MAKKFYKSREIIQIVEYQMHHWEQARQSRTVHLSGGTGIDYIAISRQVGSGGGEIARILANLMKWQLYDKDILDYLAEDLKVHRTIIECVDERTQGWIDDWLKPIFRGQSSKMVKQIDYYRHLLKVLMVLGKLGQAIIVGRAASQILPRDHGLSVRITAPFELRCQRYADRHQIAIKEAQTIVEKNDCEQERFVKDFLNKDINDVQYYDFIYSTEKLSPMSVAKLIWRAFDLCLENQPDQ